jgi:hypothetical protein
VTYIIPTRLKGDWITLDQRLDRVPSEVTEHLERYPLSAATMPAKSMSMIAGVNWYEGMMEPARGTFQHHPWVLGSRPLGRLVGGHAVCLRNAKVRDSDGWWRFYDQGVEGRCVEFAMLRMLTHANRKRYDITTRWHYWEAQRSDEWPGGSYPGASPRYEGTSVRAGLEVLRSRGAIPALRNGRTYAPGRELGALVSPEDGIATYRWARTWDDVREVLQVPDSQPGVSLLNSWGTAWPREVLLLDELGERLLEREGGEFGVITDR